jgi:tripartite-type tricarboxylate transporter receptor subunit TctC
MAPVLPHIRAGKLVPIAVTTPKRVTWESEVPTVAETPGMQGFEATHWMGVLVPAQTPAPIVQKLQSEFAAVLHTPAVRAQLQKMGIDAVGSSSAEFATFMHAEHDRFANMFTYTGLTPE